MATKRQMGNMDLSLVDFRGDEPDKSVRTWEKPRQWYGRCNREWQLSAKPGSWQHYTAPFDTLDLPSATGVAGAPVYRAAVAVNASGNRKGFLWLGLRGKMTARLNGEVVAQLSSQTLPQRSTW